MREVAVIFASRTIGLTLVALVALIYGLSLGAPLMFDDIPNLLENPLMQFERSTFDGWRSATMSGEAGVLLRPVSMFSFAINYGLSGGYDPVALKATNLFIHLLCAALVYRLAHAVFAALGRGDPATGHLALLAAAIWALHPLHVSTVLYAVQRMAQLSTLFILLGLVVYSHYRLRWLDRLPAPGEVAALLLWGALLSCLAVLSKENGVLLPWLAVALEFSVFRGRFGRRDYPWLHGLAFFLLVLPVVAVLLTLATHPAAITGGYLSRDFSLAERLLTQLRVLWHYVYWFFWPDLRNMGFQHDDIARSTSWLEPATTLVAALAWGAMLAAAVALRQRAPLLLSALLLFLVGHALESSVLPLEMVFEHRNYLPSVGLALLAAGLLDGLCRRLPYLRPRVLYVPVLLILLLLLGVRAHTWSDMTRFARVNAANHPGSVRAQFFHADALYSQVGVPKAPGEATDGALLFAAREQFIRVNELAGGHATALVMLYFADQVYLAELEDRPDWLTHLSRTLLKGGPLTSSDYGAIEALTACAIKGVCEADRSRVLQLLEKLLQYSPGNFRLLEQRYQLSLAMGLDDAKLDSLAQLQLSAPYIPVLNSYALTQAAAQGDNAGVYQAMAAWLAGDRMRRYLPLLREIAQKRARGISGEER